MAQESVMFSDEIPDRYERLMGPFFFKPYAKNVAARISPSASDILEIACGTGIVTEAIRAQLPDARIIASDLSDGMLAQAAQKPALRGIVFEQADAQALPFPDNSFDTVVCQFGIMFVPDKEAAAAEVHRVLRSGGEWIFSTWDQLEKNGPAAQSRRVVAEFFPDDQPGFAAIPFSMWDPEELRQLALGAGFEQVKVENVRLRCASPAPDLALGLITGTPMANAINERDPSLIGPIVESLREALATNYGDPVEDTLSAWVCTAIKS